jgi:nitrilase
MSIVKAACVQAAPVFLDRKASTEKACRLIQEAADSGAEIVAFSEAFIAGYPIWVWTEVQADYGQIPELYGRLLDQAVALDSPTVDTLKECAADNKITVSIGINEINQEASGGSLFNSNLMIDNQGEVIACHRKLMPTGPERLFWSQGDGSTLGPWDSNVGKLGCLICWENYMPLARYSQIAGGAQIILAPTYDEGDRWNSTIKHSSMESKAFFISPTVCFKVGDIPDSLKSVRDAYGTDPEAWAKPGGSLITGPAGEVLAGPLESEEGIIYADLDFMDLKKTRWNLDAGGHYSRPDVLSLNIDRRAKKQAISTEG